MKWFITKSQGIQNFCPAEQQALEKKYLLQQLVLNANTVRFSTHTLTYSYIPTHWHIYSSCKNLFRMRDKGQCHCVFFLHMKWIVLMLIVFGHHEDCVFDVNTHIAGFFLLVFFLDMSSQAILSKFHFAMITIHLFTRFKCSILLCSLKWA